MADVEAPEVAHQEEAPADILSDHDTTGIASEIETETEKETEKENPPKEATNGVKKENVPPKRGIAPKRPGSTTTSSATKPTTSSATRTTTGGLSKPPTRAPIGSTVRKSTSSATAPTSASAGHRSQPSIGGSGDEKKKPLAAAAPRTSLAPTGVHHSPAKHETLAEKRASATSTSAAPRKPATSVSTLSPKPATKPSTSSTAARTTGTSSTTTTNRSAPISKPASSGAVADAKKRLSTISGSPSTSKTTTRPASHSTGPSSSKEIDELKAKLEDSETRVEELQKEIASSQEKLLELGKQIELEAAKVSEVEETIRGQHNEMIEKLHAKHKTDVEELQAQLAEAEVTKAAVQEASLKAVEDAQQTASAKGASDLTEALEQLKTQHASELKALNAELISAKEAASSASSATAKKETEIATLKSQIAKDNEKLEALKLDHQTALSALKKSLIDEHESALAALKTAHSADLARGSTDATSAYEEQVAELTKTHEAAHSELQSQLEKSVAAQASLEASHKEKLDSHQTESAAAISELEAELAGLKAKAESDSKLLAQSSKDIQDLNAKSESTQKQLSLAEEEISATSKKLEALQAKSGEDAEALAIAKKDLAAAQGEVISLQKVMDTYDTDGKNKDELHRKVKAELASTIKSLNDKIKEISNLQEKHRKELETVSNDYEKEIEALQGNSGVKEELEVLKAKHAELTKSHSDATKAHTKELDQLAKSHSDANANYAKVLEQLKQDHATAVAALDSKETAHHKALEDLKTVHAKNLDEAHDRAITAGDAAHASDIEQLQASHSDAIAALKQQHAAFQASALADAETRKATEASLQAEIAKTNESLLKAHSELDALKQNLAHEKMEKASAQADLEAIKSIKPDTSEADTLRKELQALKDQHQAALMTARQESAKATEEHLATRASLENAQAELGRQKAESEADFKDMHDSLTQLVEEANKRSADLEARLKEADAVLKVKDAELAEAKTKNTVLSSPKTPTGTKGLAASKYAEDADPAESKSEVVEGEHDSSSAALASLAKARVLAQQLEQMNDDAKQDNLRSLESITDVSPSLAV